MMFENYEVDDEDDSFFVPDWRDETEDDRFDRLQVVFIDEEIPSMWELAGVGDDDFED